MNDCRRGPRDTALAEPSGAGAGAKARCPRTGDCVANVSARPCATNSTTLRTSITLEWPETSGWEYTMKSFVIVVLLGLATVAHAAQVYEWVDEKGVKQYTQQPPPPNVKNVTQKRLTTSVVETRGPSYSMQQAMKNFPVTLYITDCG